MNLQYRTPTKLTKRLLGAGSLLAIVAFTTGCETDGTADYDDDDDDRPAYYHTAAYQPVTTHTRTVVYEQPQAETVVYKRPYVETEIFRSPRSTFREEVAYSQPAPSTRYHVKPEQPRTRYSESNYGEYSKPRTRMNLDVSVEAPKEKRRTSVAKVESRPAKVEKPEEKMITADTPVSDPVVSAKPIMGSNLELPEPKPAPKKPSTETAPPSSIATDNSDQSQEVGAASVGYAVATYR